jgi:UDP-N-acetylglucosamine--N-acetylmuramyl-(pentapeptide) pyrophosphoryl-undecaprenol N-acetylglucosamine transferase
VTSYLLAGGGTAGHVSPLLAVADRLRSHDPTAQIIVLGTAEGLESRLVPERGYELVTIERVPFPRRLNRAAFTFPARLRRAVRATRDTIRSRRIDVVVGFGGYASAPAYLAARRERIPIAIHEANAKPGFANRLGSMFASRVGVAYPRTRLRRATFVGMPLRPEIESLDKAVAREQGLRLFGLQAGRRVLLVTGGSTGARSINKTILETAQLLLGAGWQVLHIAGEKTEFADPRLPGYVFLKYCDRMELALAVADLAVSRAGSATVSELAALGIPAIYVPYPVGNGEQRFNAAEVVAAGGALLVNDAEFDTGWVSRVLVPLLADPAMIAEMAVRSASVGVLDGTDRMTFLVSRASARR